jgi:predicted DNA-binding transcriptional regulator AlpA
MTHAAALEATEQRTDHLVTETEAAVLMGLAPRTLQSWRQHGRGPRYIRVSARAVRYRRSDLLAWITDREDGGQ